jgi:hypothetical protein
MLFPFFDGGSKFLYFRRNELSGLFEHLAEFPCQFLLIYCEEGYWNPFFTSSASSADSVNVVRNLK